MTGPFDTVDEIEEWLETEPTRSEAEEALSVEEDHENRTTGKGAIRKYIDSFPEPGGDDDAVEFRVQSPYGDYRPGDTVELNPDSTEAARLRREGRIRRT